MKKTLFAVSMMVAAVAFAAEPMKANEPMKTTEAPAAAAAKWAPRKVTKKDTKGIEALYKACEDAMAKGDVETIASHWDFPAWMLTDNAAGVTSAMNWSKEEWVKSMKPAIEGMPKDAKMSTKTKVTFLSDSIAWVEENHSMQMGKAKESWVSGSYVVLKDGKWLFKSAAEGGWGDVTPEKKAEAPAMAPATAPGTKAAVNTVTK